MAQLLEHRVNSRNERIRFDGFRVFDEKERELYDLIGPKLFFRVIHSGFRRAYLEAEYIGLERKGEAFVNLCESSRINSVNGALDTYIALTLGLPKGTKIIYGYDEFSDEALLEDIKRSYGRSS